MMFTTAYGAFIEDAKIGAGDFVVITAPSSSVGLATIQVAKYAGATPIDLKYGRPNGWRLKVN